MEGAGDLHGYPHALPHGHPFALLQGIRLNVLQESSCNDELREVGAASWGAAGVRQAARQGPGLCSRF